MESLTMLFSGQWTSAGNTLTLCKEASHLSYLRQTLRKRKVSFCPSKGAKEVDSSHLEGRSADRSYNITMTQGPPSAQFSPGVICFALL